MDANGYINRMKTSFKRLFPGKQPNTKYHSPLEVGDHPELDTSPFLDEKWTQIYQSMIGATQWAVSIGHFDINVAVMSLSIFRAMPREGHLERLKRMYGYLCKFQHFKIRFRTDEPDFTDTPMPKHDWSNTCYGNPQEELPHDAPPPLGKRVTIMAYFDANLMHDVLSGKAVTVILYFYNKTPVEWSCKKQSTSETAMYGAEYISGRSCIEGIIDHRNSLRYLGVPINVITYVFGDNDTMIKSSTIPHARLHKRHNILSFHFVRSTISCGYINMQHIRSEYNFADVLSKNWSHQSVYDLLLKPLFHHVGNTEDLFEHDTITPNPSRYDPEKHPILYIDQDCG